MRGRRPPQIEFHFRQRNIVAVGRLYVPFCHACRPLYAPSSAKLGVAAPRLFHKHLALVIMASELDRQTNSQAAYQPDLEKSATQEVQDPEAAHPAPAATMPDGEPAPRPLSKVQTFGLIATCTTAMILNVCAPFVLARHTDVHTAQTSLNTAVAIALPTMGKDLGIPNYRLQWVISAYTLSSVCTHSLMGVAHAR